MKKLKRPAEYIKDLKYLLTHVPAVHLDQLMEFIVRRHKISYDAAAIGIKTIIENEAVYISNDGYITDSRRLRIMYPEFKVEYKNKYIKNNMPLTISDRRHLDALWIIILHYTEDISFTMLNGETPANALMNLNGKTYEIISFTPYAEIQESTILKLYYTYSPDIRTSLFRYAIVSDRLSPKDFPYVGFTKFYYFDKDQDSLSIFGLEEFSRDEKTAWRDVN